MPTDCRVWQFGWRSTDVAVDRGRSWAAALPVLHHTDSGREYEYDRFARVGRLDKGLEEARAKGWTVVDMKEDWKRVFPCKR